MKEFEMVEILLKTVAWLIWLEAFRNMCASAVKIWAFNHFQKLPFLLKIIRSMIVQIVLKLQTTSMCWSYFHICGIWKTTHIVIIFVACKYIVKMIRDLLSIIDWSENRNSIKVVIGQLLGDYLKQVSFWFPVITPLLKRISLMTV